MLSSRFHLFASAASSFFLPVVICEDALYYKQGESLVDSFRTLLVQHPDDKRDSGMKSIVNFAVQELMTPEEWKVLDDYDSLFEKYSLFCNGRWMGAQLLQDSQDLMYMQHIVYSAKPDIIIETGTYKGGLTYFFATILEMVGLEESRNVGKEQFKRSVVSLDRHHPARVHDANWFCPPCPTCIKTWESPLWEQRVRFVEGWSTDVEVLYDVYAHMEALSQGVEKKIMVNLDAAHEYDNVLKELVFYAPLVSVGSYLVVQDIKLDAIWGKPAVSAAIQQFMELIPEFEFVIENEMKFHAYSQHLYLRRTQKTMNGNELFMQMYPKDFENLLKLNVLKTQMIEEAMEEQKRNEM